MPQFDILTFVAQVLGFGSALVFVYFFITRKVLPKISENLKIREKLKTSHLDNPKRPYSAAQRIWKDIVKFFIQK